MFSGLARAFAWPLDRRRNWSDSHGNVESVFPRDHMVTNATIYWIVLVAPQVRAASPCATSSDPDDWYPAWGVARWKTVLRGHLNAVLR